MNGALTVGGGGGCHGFILGSRTAGAGEVASVIGCQVVAHTQGSALAIAD